MELLEKEYSEFEGQISEFTNQEIQLVHDCEAVAKRLELMGYNLGDAKVIRLIIMGFKHYRKLYNGMKPKTQAEDAAYEDQKAVAPQPDQSAG